MNKSSALKQGLGFGIFMGIFFIAQNLFQLKEYTPPLIIRTILLGIVAATLAGVLFGLFIKWFTKSSYVKASKNITLNEDEAIKKISAANHFRKAEVVGGHLFLTNQRLSFKPHKINFQQYEINIALSDIKGVEKKKSLGIVSNILLVTLQNNTQEKFVVNNLQEWINEFNHL